MATDITFDEVSFGALPELSLFLLVVANSEGGCCLGRSIYQKYTWQTFNAIQHTDSGPCDRERILVGEDQLVFPLD